MALSIDCKTCATRNAQALAGAPRVGTALPVVQHGTRSLPREIPLPAAGAWVRLRNLAATLVNGQLQVGPALSEFSSACELDAVKLTQDSWRALQQQALASLHAPLLKISACTPICL